MTPSCNTAAVGVPARRAGAVLFALHRGRQPTSSPRGSLVPVLGLSEQRRPHGRGALASANPVDERSANRSIVGLHVLVPAVGLQFTTASVTDTVVVSPVAVYPISCWATSPGGKQCTMDHLYCFTDILPRLQMSFPLGMR